jgi:hypothetical protein
MHGWLLGRSCWRLIDTLHPWTNDVTWVFALVNTGLESSTTKIPSPCGAAVADVAAVPFRCRRGAPANKALGRSLLRLIVGRLDGLTFSAQDGHPIVERSILRCCEQRGVRGCPAGADRDHHHRAARLAEHG